MCNRSGVARDRTFEYRLFFYSNILKRVILLFALLQNFSQPRRRRMPRRTGSENWLYSKKKVVISVMESNLFQFSLDVNLVAHDHVHNRLITLILVVVYAFFHVERYPDRLRKFFRIKRLLCLDPEQGIHLYDDIDKSFLILIRNVLKELLNFCFLGFDVAGIPPQLVRWQGEAHRDERAFVLSNAALVAKLLPIPRSTRFWYASRHPGDLFGALRGADNFQIFWYCASWHKITNILLNPS